MEISESADKLADLSVKSLKLARKVKRGRKANIKAQVKNNGKANCGASSISFYLSENNDKSVEGDKFLGSRKVKGIKKKKRRTVKYLWKVNDNPGSYYIKALCDSSEKISESKEGNNIGLSGGVKVR